MDDLKHIKRMSTADATDAQLVCLPGQIASEYNYCVQHCDQKYILEYTFFK